MINTNNQKVREVIEVIHEAMLRTVKRGGKVREDILLEGRILSVMCEAGDPGPSRCADIVNGKYGYDLTGDEVIQIFRDRRLANPAERKELLQWAKR